MRDIAERVGGHRAVGAEVRGAWCYDPNLSREQACLSGPGRVPGIVTWLATATRNALGASVRQIGCWRYRAARVIPLLLWASAVSVGWWLGDVTLTGPSSSVPPLTSPRHLLADTEAPDAQTQTSFHVAAGHEEHARSADTAGDVDLPASGALAVHRAHLAETDLIVTSVQQADADAFAGAVREAVLHLYATVDDARRSGYVAVGPATPTGPLVRLYDVDLQRDRTWLEPDRPHVLVYFAGAGGALGPLGAAFLAPTGEGPRIGGGLTLWYPHPGLCLDENDRLAGLLDPTWGCPLGSTPSLPGLEALHVWLFDNPDGRFAGLLSQAAARRARQTLTER
ncbi:MAG: hypothetical protein IT305_18370 [Chloroflexi bacterium]|nr:hypothetical protein [Chloroflexota bacterium]